MNLQTIDAHFLRTIDWLSDQLIDWCNGVVYYNREDEQDERPKYSFAFDFDGSITSQNNKYVLLYQRLGTKALLLKNGELLREINRSYYHASAYEFPAAFIEYKGRTYLVHCPNDYDRLDFEDVETGDILTDISTRKPKDFFHSRLEVSQDNKFLISKGWYWHPWDAVLLFDIEQCFEDPKVLDEGRGMPDILTEICSASILDQERILVGASSEESMGDENEVPNIPPNHIALWNIKNNEIEHAVEVKEPFGNLFAIDQYRCWDLYEYPKIIDIRTGTVLDKNGEVFSGKQNSSIIHGPEELPMIAYNKKTKQIAIGHHDKIHLLSC